MTVSLYVGFLNKHMLIPDKIGLHAKLVYIQNWFTYKIGLQATNRKGADFQIYNTAKPSQFHINYTLCGLFYQVGKDCHAKMYTKHD